MSIRTLFLLFFSLSFAQLIAQPKFLVYGGISIERPAVGEDNYDNPLVAYPLVEPGWALEFSNAELVLFLHFSYQQLDVGPDYLNFSAESLQQQRFAIQNLRSGPGFRYLPWKNRRLRPVISAGFVFGVPLQFEYEYFNASGDIRLPVYGKVQDGASIGTGWNFMLGLDLKLNDHWDCAVSVGRTNYSQLFGRVGKVWPEWDAGYVFSGGANLAQVGMIYRR